MVSKVFHIDLSKPRACSPVIVPVNRHVFVVANVERNNVSIHHVISDIFKVDSFGDRSENDVRLLLAEFLLVCSSKGLINVEFWHFQISS